MTARGERNRAAGGFVVCVVVSARVEILLMDRAHVERERELFKRRAGHERFEREQDRERVAGVFIHGVKSIDQRAEGAFVRRRHASIIPDEDPPVNEQQRGLTSHITRWRSRSSGRQQC